VDPVEVWEGIDTHEDQGHNRLSKLAQHILSIVPNSAGCERAFSHMGLVHTAICSKLSVDKVCKTTVVGMDIKRSHIEPGLVCARGRQNFEVPTTSGDPPEEPLPDFDVGDIEDVLDFDQLAKELIEDAAADTSSDLDHEEPPAVPLTIWLPLHAIQNVLPDPPPSAIFPKTAIPLKSLFIFPTDQNTSLQGMDCFWKGGIENLEREMEAYKILCLAQDSSATVGDVPMSSTTSSSAIPHD
jgi:hypothetical protein